MLKEGTGVKRVIIRAGRTDLRRGIDGLKSIIQLAYGMNPMEEGTLFLFCGSRRDRIKGLLYEGLSEDFCYPHIFKKQACNHFFTGVFQPKMCG